MWPVCVRVRAGGGASHAARPSAFQHASGLPRAPRAASPPPTATLMGSYVFVQRFLLFAAAVLLFFVEEVHAPALFTCSSDIVSDWRLDALIRFPSKQ